MNFRISPAKRWPLSIFLRPQCVHDMMYLFLEEDGGWVAVIPILKVVRCDGHVGDIPYYINPHLSAASSSIRNNVYLSIRLSICMPVTILGSLLQFSLKFHEIHRKHSPCYSFTASFMLTASFMCLRKYRHIIMYPPSCFQVSVPLSWMSTHPFWWKTQWPHDQIQTGRHLCTVGIPTVLSQITRFMGPTMAHLGPVGPRWTPCWPREEPCYQGVCLCIRAWAPSATGVEAVIVILRVTTWYNQLWQNMA